MLTAHNIATLTEALTAILSKPISRDAIFVFSQTSCVLLTFKTRNRGYRTHLTPYCRLKRVNGSEKEFSTCISSLVHEDRPWVTTKHEDDGFSWVEASNGIFRIDLQSSSSDYPNGDVLDHLTANRHDNDYLQTAVATILVFLEVPTNPGPYYIQGA